MKIPLLSVDLIKLLEEQFPDQFPSPEDFPDERRMWAEAGKRELIRNLRIYLEQQEEEARENEEGVLNA